MRSRRPCSQRWCAGACAKAQGGGADAAGGGGGDGGSDAAPMCAGASCDDSNACTTDLCDADDNCVHDPIVCDDGDMCTTDTCDAITGCTFTPPQLTGDDCPAGAIDVSAGGTFTGDAFCAADDASGSCGAGPTLTLRYENMRAVAGGCGSAKPDTTGTSTVTLYQ